eukprot:1161487-Pelagomonas_calceolata.AAC.5
MEFHAQAQKHCFKLVTARSNRLQNPVVHQACMSDRLVARKHHLHGRSSWPCADPSVQWLLCGLCQHVDANQPQLPFTSYSPTSTARQLSWSAPATISLALAVCSFTSTCITWESSKYLGNSCMFSAVLALIQSYGSKLMLSLQQRCADEGCRK